ncbi:MAG: DUF2973 domain-containing protein [Cyanophyceae cyanobacterium]|jgi:hypothetical protein
MLQFLYLVAFALISFLTLRNLLGNLITLGREQQRPARRRRPVPHPELVDEYGNLTDEPLLVIRETSLDEARNRLDSLYYESPDDVAER